MEPLNLALFFSTVCFVILLYCIWLFYAEVIRPDQEFKAYIRERKKYKA
jgi:hypothetical protein